LVPRNGFKPLDLGRFATKAEFTEIVTTYGLTEDDISDEFEQIVGEVYGPAVKQTIKVRQLRIEGNAIPAESAIQNRGIYAQSNDAGRIDIRVG
jgi:hypothetical protein